MSYTSSLNYVKQKNVVKVIKYLRNGEWQGEYAAIDTSVRGPKHHPNWGWVTSNIPPQCFPDTFTLDLYEEYWKKLNVDIFADMPRECIRIVQVELVEVGEHNPKRKTIDNIGATRLDISTNKLGKIVVKDQNGNIISEQG